MAERGFSDEDAIVSSRATIADGRYYARETLVENRLSRNFDETLFSGHTQPIGTRQDNTIWEIAVGNLHRIRVPDADIAAAKASLVNWLVRRGALVSAGERVAEILVGEILLEATAPATGKLVEKCVAVDQDVVAGQVLAWVEEEASGERAA